MINTRRLLRESDDHAVGPLSPDLWTALKPLRNEVELFLAPVVCGMAARDMTAASADEALKKNPVILPNACVTAAHWTPPGPIGFALAHESTMKPDTVATSSMKLLYHQRQPVPT